RRAHCTIFSTVVVRTGISSSAIVVTRTASSQNPRAQSQNSSLEHYASPMPYFWLLASGFWLLAPSALSLPLPAPIERALAPHIDVAGHEQRKEAHELPEAGPAESAERDRPRVQ